MKIKFKALVACTVLSFTMVSCDLFSSRSASLSDDIIGKWKIDSVTAQKDSAGNIGILLLAMALKDSNDLVLDFKKDSIFTFVKDSVVESAAYQVNEKEKQISIDKEIYTVQSIKDSVLHLTQIDSSEIFLKKF
jgi:hypothetical protein